MHWPWGLKVEGQGHMIVKFAAGMGLQVDTTAQVFSLFFVLWPVIGTLVVDGDDYNNALSGCWSAEPHDRPSFRDVLTLLDKISRSEFVTTTHESFREIQEDWHREIEEMFDELRTKEKVISYLFSCRTFLFYRYPKSPWKIAINYALTKAVNLLENKHMLLHLFSI